jgi:hypothetical protein
MRSVDMWDMTVLGFNSITIMVLAWLMSSAFIASEAESVHEGGVGGARMGVVLEVEAVRELLEMEGGIWLV